MPDLVGLQSTTLGFINRRLAVLLHLSIPAHLNRFGDSMDELHSFEE